MFSYKPLFKTLIENNLSKTQLREKVGFSSATLAKISKDEYVSMETLDNICKFLDCDIEDVIRHEK